MRSPRGRRLSTIHGGPDFPRRRQCGSLSMLTEWDECPTCCRYPTAPAVGQGLRGQGADDSYFQSSGLDSWDLGSTLWQCACHCAARPWRRRSRIPACWQKAAGGRLGPRRVGQTPRKENISASGARVRGTATGARASRFISGWQFRPRLHPRIPATRHRQNPRD